MSEYTFTTANHSSLKCVNDAFSYYYLLLDACVLSHQAYFLSNLRNQIVCSVVVIVVLHVCGNENIVGQVKQHLWKK